MGSEAKQQASEESTGIGTRRLSFVQLSEMLEELTSRRGQDPLLDIALDLLHQCKERIEDQALELAMLRKHAFGRRSERVAPDTPSLFGDLLQEVMKAPEPAEEPSGDAKPPEPKPPKRKPQRRRPLTPTQIVPLDVPPEERACPDCGDARHTIGREVSIVIEHTPARVEVIQYEREKIACKPCQGELARADPPEEKVVERAAPGPGMLSALAIYKHVDGLPLHRIHRILARSGVDLAIQTLNRWEELGRTLVQPVTQGICDQMLGADAICLDDTGLRVRDPHAEHGIRRGHIWVFVGLKFDPGGDLSRTEEWVYYIYAPTWHARYPEELLKDFRGLLHGDAYGGYDRVAGADKAEVKNILAGCSMHARRPFVRALEMGDSLARLFVDGFREIYAVEARAKAERLRADERLELRQEMSLPIWDRMRERADELEPLPLGRPLREGLRYLANQWPKLCVPFTLDGRLEIDTGAAERRLRRLATGRRAWLFAGSENGAHRIADIISIISTADAAGIDPGRYLHDIFRKIAGGWPQSRLADLLPYGWRQLQQSPQ